MSEDLKLKLQLLFPYEFFLLKNQDSQVQTNVEQKISCTKHLKYLEKRQQHSKKCHVSMRNVT